MPNDDGLSQLARVLLASEWGLRNPRGDQDVTPGGFDASVLQPVDPRMERVLPGSRMELDPQDQVDRWLGILRSLPQRT
jgi:hypothetical protein